MSTLLNIYLCLIIIFPWFSSLLYLFFPGETMKYFGDLPTSSGQFWVRVVASGDILVGFLAFIGLRTRNNEILKLVLQSIAIYTLFHMSTFWYDHTFRKQHPNGPIFYIILLVMSLAACGWWPWWKPPYHLNNSSHMKDQ
ncbi:hypothetical protein I4U23_005803 [Adineta vaga]|nr:hypothetical protein I4U23_005803 [Adineta vaga]